MAMYKEATQPLKPVLKYLYYFMTLGNEEFLWISFSTALREKPPEYEQKYEKVIILHDNVRPHVADFVKLFENA